jgi:hypothetical protein
VRDAHFNRTTALRPNEKRNPMVGLIDIAPKIKTVDVQGVSVTVHGISAKSVAHLLGHFPSCLC